MAMKGTTLPSISYGFYDTIVHEFTHIPQRNHEESFVTEYHDLASKLAADGFNIQIHMLLSRTLKKHKDTFLNLRDNYESSTTKNIAKSLHEGEGNLGTASIRGSSTGAANGNGSNGDAPGPVQTGKGNTGREGLPGNAGLSESNKERSGTQSNTGLVNEQGTALYSIAGVNAQTADKYQLESANLRLQNGEDAEQVRKDMRVLI